MVKRIDGNIDLQSVIDGFARLRVEVGFFDTDKYPDGTSVAYVAAINEFGYVKGGIPSRPFFRTALQNNVAKMKSVSRLLVLQVVEGKIDPRQAVDQLGLYFAGKVSDSIRDGDWAPLAASTLAARQSRKRTPGVAEKPLIDTARMLQSVKHSVVSG